MGLPIVTRGGGRTTSLRHPAAGKIITSIKLFMTRTTIYNGIFSGLAMATTAPVLVNQYVPHVTPSCMPQGVQS